VRITETPVTPAAIVEMVAAGEGAKV
jgi:hypothetical protein